MTKTLEKYLEEEINYAISEHLRKHKIPKIKEHLDYFYDILGYFKSNMKDPQAVFNYITNKWEQEGHEYKIKYLYADITYNLMVSKEYEEWQLKKIQEKLKEYRDNLKLEKKKNKEEKEKMNNMILNLYKGIANQYIGIQDKRRDWENKKREVQLKNQRYKAMLFTLPQKPELSSKIIKIMYVTLQKNNFIKSTKYNGMAKKLS